jgi:hypothetical protein
VVGAEVGVLAGAQAASSIAKTASTVNIEKKKERVFI